VPLSQAKRPLSRDPGSTRGVAAEEIWINTPHGLVNPIPLLYSMWLTRALIASAILPACVAPRG
jgi:hypothetical protein